MINKKSRYSKLLRSQKLIRERNRMKVKNTSRDLSRLEERDFYLFSLLQEEQKENFINVNLITRHLAQNRKQETMLQIRKSNEINELLQSTCQCKILQKKQKEEKDNQDRKKITELLESYIEHFTLHPVSHQFDQ